jgi:hypothetical protein
MKSSSSPIWHEEPPVNFRPAVREGSHVPHCVIISVSIWMSANAPST